MTEKKNEFVVNDRRRFAPEGELREGTPTAEEEEKPVVAQAPPVESAPTPADEAKDIETEEIPPPPSAHEQQQQTDAYKASGKKLDELFSQAGRGQERVPMEMTFERLVESFYMTALIQMGAIRQEGEPPAVDVMGARQTIDSLTIFQEKTKGNLTDREQGLLQNVLFELRMAWIEITNAIAKGAMGGPGSGPKGPLSGISNP
jgi:hypothetical protein